METLEIGNEWITTSQAAELTGYTPGHIRKLAQSGQLPTTRVGRDWLVKREAVLEWQRKMDALGTGKHNPWREDRPDLAETERGRIK